MRLKSKAPLRWNSLDSFGFVFYLRIRLSVVVSWLYKRSQICNGDLVSALYRPSIKCSLQVPIDFPAALIRCRYVGANWKLVIFFLVNVFSPALHLLYKTFNRWLEIAFHQIFLDRTVDSTI